MTTSKGKKMIKKLLRMKEIETMFVKRLSKQQVPDREEMESMLQELRDYMYILQAEMVETLGIYPNRYQARKNRRYDEVTVKVEGGYMNMPYTEYNTWRKQR